MNFLLNKYKVHGRNKGRKKNILFENNILDNFLLNMNKDIIKNKDIILDIGSGSGENTLFLSKNNLRSLIIACDVFKDGNINLCNKLYQKNILNIKLFNKNINLLLDQLSKKGCLREVWILFPDPWPKKRHHKRRLISLELLEKFHHLLKKNGKIFISTDSQSYLLSILKNIYLSKQKYKWENDKPYIWSYNLEKLPATKYYKKAIKLNKSPFFISLIKI